MNHSLKDWMTAIRPWSFPASAMPVIVTLAYLFWQDVPANWTNGVWALFNIILFHAAGNTWSDYFDHKYQVDATDTFGAKTLTNKLFTPREILYLSIALLTIALTAGIGLLLRSGLPLLYIGFGGLLCSLLYPMLKYNALGDVVIFFAYALLPTLGCAYATTGLILWKVLLFAIPIGLITVAILHANNTRDIETDHRAKIRTLAMHIGRTPSMHLYSIEIIFPFGWILGCILTGAFPWLTLLNMVALIPAMLNVRTMRQYPSKGMSAIADLDEKTAKLQLLFSLLLALSFFLSALL